VCATVVLGVDGLVFEVAEHVLDLVSLFVEDGVMRDRGVPVGLRWDAGGDAALCEGGAEPIGVVALVGEKLLGLGRGGQHRRSALAIAHLPLA